MSLYERLGVERGADAQEIRRAYLKLSKTEHPDKGGSEERFKEIQQAYEVLSDDQQRAFYDQTGQLPGEGGGGGGPPGGMPFGFGGGGMPFHFDIGSMFGGMFGGGGPGGGQMHRRPRAPKAPPKSHEINLTLHDFFYGKTIKLKFDRQKFCETCKGEGAESFETCNNCGGTGMRQSVMMIGPGMQAVSRSPCGPCGGEGKQIRSACKTCNGLKFQSQEKVLTCKIEPGAKPGDVITFPNECSDQHEFMEPGDVNIILKEADESSNFTRVGDDLTIVVQVTLTEALLGTKKVLRGHPAHPAGLEITIPAGVMRGDHVNIRGEGFPRGPSGGARGNLQITMAVDVTPAEKELLVVRRAALEAALTAAS